MGAYVMHCEAAAAPCLKRTRCATMSHCYLVRGSYAKRLREQFERCLVVDIQNDIGWWPLMWQDDWFILDPVVAGQRDGLSDMSGKKENTLII